MNLLQDILNGAIGPLGGKSTKHPKLAERKMAKRKMLPLQHINGSVLPAAQPYQSPIIGAMPIRPGKTPYSPGEGPFIPRR